MVFIYESLSFFDFRKIRDDEEGRDPKFSGAIILANFLAYFQYGEGSANPSKHLRNTAQKSWILYSHSSLELKMSTSRMENLVFYSNSP